MNLMNAEEEVERIFRLVDRDNSGEIDYTEFLLATFDQKQLLEKESLQMAFKILDKVIYCKYT